MIHNKHAFIFLLLCFVSFHEIKTAENDQAPSNGQKCNKKLQSIFIQGANFKPEGNSESNAKIDKVCNSEHQTNPKKYCCSNNEFDSLLEQYQVALEKLTRLKNKVVRLFEYAKNIEKQEFQRLISNAQSIPNPVSAVGPNLMMVLQDLNKRGVLSVLRDFNDFIQWKIGQIGKLVCMICSPVNQNYIGEDALGPMLLLSNNFCVSSMQQYGKMDNLGYYLIHLSTLVKGILIKNQRFIPKEIQQLPDLNKWTDLTNKRGRCLDPNKNPFENPQCLGAIESASNPTIMSPYRKISFLVDYLYVEIKEFFGPEVSLVDEERKMKTLSDEELAELEVERPMEAAEWDFRPFKTYFTGSKNIYPFDFRVKCVHYGINPERYNLEISKENLPFRRNPHRPLPINDDDSINTENSLSGLDSRTRENVNILSFTVLLCFLSLVSVSV